MLARARASTQTLPSESPRAALAALVRPKIEALLDCEQVHRILRNEFDDLELPDVSLLAAGSICEPIAESELREEAGVLEGGERAEEKARKAAEERTPDDLRAMGWSVAVHNDYRINGEPHTFWLFTKDERAVKGEGHTDADALNQIRAALASRPGQVDKPEPAAKGVNGRRRTREPRSTFPA